MRKQTARLFPLAVVSIAALGLHGSAWLPPARADRASSVGAAVEWEGTLLVQVRVTDLDRSIDFYTRVLGFTLERRNDAIHWARIKPGIAGVTLGLGEGDSKGSGTTSMNFGVRDLAAARGSIEARGAEFLGPTVTVPGIVMLADLMDPDGNKIRLAQDIKDD